MRVTILHQTVEPDASEDEKDVLLQVESVAESLKRLGHTTQTAEASLDLEQARLDLVATDPDRVFYLVESLDGTDSLAHLPAFLLENMQIPYTGAPAAALVLTNNKVRAKRLMALAGLPTPPWLEHGKRRRSDKPCTTPCQQAVPDSSHGLQSTSDTQREDRPAAINVRFPATFILKPIEEHASQGMTDDCVFDASDERQLREKLQDHSDLVDRLCFAEQFIDGREFNLAVLGTPDGPIVLPPAEIDFTSFPPGKPHIVGYDAKWVSNSFEYKCTPRRFPCTPSSKDFELGRRLTDLARNCWDVFALRGYARVDFRVDHEGNPWILEVNTNPCLSPDAGFAAALQEAGISPDQAVQSILDDTCSF